MEANFRYKDRSFSNKIGYKNFNWEKFLSQEEITEEMWNDAYILSREWVFDPQASQSMKIERYHTGRPVDEYLSEISLRFNESIQNQDQDEALKLLYEIEQRCKELT